MIFKVLFSQFSFAEIRPAFLNLWQTNEPKLVGHLDLDKWERIYQNVQVLDAKSSQYYIRLVWRWETCSPMIDMNCSVYDKVDNHLDCPMACYPSWSEIAGMEVVVEKDIVITPQELVQACCGKSLTLVGQKRLHERIWKEHFMEERNETRTYCHVHLDMYHFCHNASPAYLALWRNVGRTVDKDINRI